MRGDSNQSESGTITMLDKNIARTFAYDADTNLVATISPCSWMYPNYGLQVELRIEATGGTAHLLNRSLPFAEATEADFNAMVAQARIVPCPRCQSPAFDPTTAGTNRNGLCETCFLADLKAESAAARVREEESLRKMDTKMRRKGMTHCVDAWIHPSAGGDDYQMQLYVRGEPSEGLIQKELKRAGSSVRTDYAVRPL